MKRHSHQRWLLGVAGLLGALLCAPAPAAAQTILGNYPVSGFSPGGLNFPDRRVAVGFTLGGSPYTVTGAIFKLGAAVGFPGTELSLFSSVAGKPGVSLHTFTNVTPAETSVYDATYLPSSVLTLSANTSYFLVVRESAGGGGFVTVGSDIPVPPTGPGATFDNYQVSPDNGANWDVAAEKVSFQLLGTEGGGAPAVPEPASFILLFPALAVAGIIHRRRLRC